MQSFRIFLASPGDVALERKLAREAGTHISNERRFRGCFAIEIIAWDQPGAAVAMEAGLTPQQAIAQGLPKPEDCDLAVVILWSRIGTQLPADFELKPDGTPYLSGTEWEYHNAIKGFRSERKQPATVWVYRRNGAPQFAADDPEVTSKLEQWRKVNDFFKTYSNPDGSLAGGVNHYDTPDDFRHLFEHHLRDRLEKLLESLPSTCTASLNAETEVKPLWHGSPYLGLEAFNPEQAPIYFGRGREVDQLLQQFADPKVRFVAVVGVSGSGKSSLVKAGLLPRLRTGIIGNAPWTDLIFKPGERGGNPFLALAFALKGALKTVSQTENEMARVLQADEKAAENGFYGLLQQKESQELLLVIDQFEELFTQCSDQQCQEFLACLEQWLALPRIRAIVTLRADFYPRAIEEAALAHLLRQDRGTFPLDPPRLGALHQMIIRPAEAAGIMLEEDLAQQLLDDAGGGHGALALIAFTLSQLYQHSEQANLLNLQAYQAFGGVKGAVQKRAEAALQGLRVDVDKVLPELFSKLVEVNEQEVATRRRAPQAQLQGGLKTIADALTEARLLTASEGEDRQAMIEVAHEIVLSGWARLRLWVEQQAPALKARRDLEQVSSEWDKAGRPGAALRSGGLLKRYLNAAAPRSQTAEAYLLACQRRRQGLRIGYATLAVLALISLAIFFHVSKSNYPPTLATKALFIQLGLWSVTQPAMVTIPAGEFQMGDLSGNGEENERPVRIVKFAKPFAIGKYEVTFAEYDLFAAATGRDKPADQGWGRADRPVINVSWNDAVAYAQWLSEHTSLTYRLPSEAEWEYAARATTTTERYWSENPAGEPDAACTYANVYDAKSVTTLYNTYNFQWEAFKCEDEFPFTAPVGKFKANLWKLHDMLGNVREWVLDCMMDVYNYQTSPIDGSAQASPDGKACLLHVSRGGSFELESQDVRSAGDRDWSVPGFHASNLGFRLVKTP